MAKLYTVDGKLLTDRPEVRIGDHVFAVDDRVKTVKALMKLTQNGANENDADEILKMGFGSKAFAEIEKLELPFVAYQNLIELVVAAMTGEEPAAVSARFPEPEKA